MKPLSEHTQLINCLIGLTRRVRDWPSTLRDLGFRLEWIGPLLTTPRGDKVQPDLLLGSKRLLYALPIEAKGGKNINESQLKHLLDLDRDSIVPRVNVHNPRELQFEIVYSSTGQNVNSVSRQVSQVADVPVIAFDSRRITKRNKFKREELEVAFKDPILLNGPAPTSFYPFDVNDDNGIVALHILRRIVGQSITRSGSGILQARDLAAEVHPLWNSMDDRTRAALESKVDSVLTEFSKRGQLQSLQRVRRGRSWKIVRTLQALREECQALVDELTEQRQITEFQA